MERLQNIAILGLAGLAGGVLAWSVGLPMPFMLGGIAGSGLAVTAIERRTGPQDLRLPKLVREVFIALIGAMIGAGFSPDLLGMLPAFWASVLAVLVFIFFAQVGGYWIMRRVGGYPPVDALYAAMPGGLIEASILGEKAGADPKRVTVQHFIRILLVVVAVPLLFWLVTGEVVGSAAGQTLGWEDWGEVDIGLVLLVAILGLMIGKRVRLPASHLMGPMILSAALHVTGVLDIHAPNWLLGTAQLVVGVGLGAQFSGLAKGVLVRGFGTGVVAVSFMMLLSLGFALALTPILPAEIRTLFLSFAPGGVTEMSLIALSLQVSPVIVAVHHLVRIVCTVFITQALGQRLIVLSGDDDRKNQG